MGVRHSLAEVEGTGTQFVAGRIEVSTLTPSLTKISPPMAFANDVSVYKLAVGLYQINIANFRGKQGIVIPVVTVGSSVVTGGGAGGPIGLVPLSSVVGAGSYITGTDTYGFVVGVSSAGTFTDADVYFQAFAF